MSTEKLAKFIVQTNFEQIPEEALAVAKKSILNGLGLAVAGSREPSGKIITEYVREIGGKPEAGVIGGGFKTNVVQAALANGTMVHALSYDDLCVTCIGHLTALLMPALFALGERDRISGKQILEAYILGWEIAAKIGTTMPGERLLSRGLQPTATAGTLAVAAAAAKVLKLDVQETRRAFGIAASQAAGLVLNEGTDTKPFHVGKASSNGMTAALLAKKGLTANDSILDNPTIGFCTVLAGEGCNLAKMAEGLGSPWDIISPSGGATIKVYASCATTHRCADAVSYLVKRHDIRAEDIAGVECRVPKAAAHMIPFPHPKTGIQGKYSMQYCIASVILEGKAGLQQFTDEKVLAPKAQDLTGKIKVSYIEGLSEADLLRYPNSATVRLKDGREFSHQVEHPKGTSQNPLSWEEVAEKFSECARIVLSEEDAKHTVDLVSNMESLKDITELMAIVSQFQSKGN